MGRGHSPQFCEGHLDDCAAWEVLGERCAEFSWKRLEAVFLVGGGHPLVAFL